MAVILISFLKEQNYYLENRIKKWKMTKSYEVLIILHTGQSDKMLEKCPTFQKV